MVQVNPPDLRLPRDAALAVATLAGVVREAPAGTVPCTGTERDAWVAEDSDTVALAAMYCHDCPVLDQCAATADLLVPDAGAWAGVVWSPNRRRLVLHARRRREARRAGSAA